MQRRISKGLLVALVLAATLTTGLPTALAGGDAPKRIVSISPTATEMLFAIGAGDEVVAVDDQSNFPEDAPITDLSGFEPNVEAIAGYEPDLVVASDPTVKQALEALDIEVLVLPAAIRLKDTYRQLRRLGRVTDHVEEADEVAESVKSDIAAIVDEIPEDRERPTAYYELDETFFSADSSTFIGRVLKLAGLANIADGADDDGSGYPQLSGEAVIDADPDVILLADTKCCGQSAETVASRPGFAGVAAVRNGTVIPLDDDIASRWGPRIVELLDQVVEATKGL